MKKAIILFVVSILFFACPKTNSSDDRFQGEWYMDSYSAFMPEQPFIQENEIVWTFKSGEKLLVQNTVEDKYPYIKKSGTYTYRIMDTKIKVDGQTFDYRFENNKLILSDKPELDGPIFSFQKIP